MTKEEFELWYEEKMKPYKGDRNWLYSKAHYLCSSMGVNYSEINEIIQSTIVVILENLEKVNVFYADGFAFLSMRNVVYNNYVYHKNWICCSGISSDDFGNYSDEKYDDTEDKKFSKNMSSLLDKVETPVENMVLVNLIDGKKEKEIIKMGAKHSEIINTKIKLGLRKPLKKSVYVYKPTGNPKGRPLKTYPKELKEHLKPEDRLLFSDYYILKRNVKEVISSHKITEKRFNTFRVRVDRKFKEIQNQKQ